MSRFAARPVAQLVDQLSDALDWPRSRPARLLAGERAAIVGRVVVCSDEAALASLDAPADAAVLLATPPLTSDGRLGRRLHDPFAGSPEDVASWRRSTRVVLDASLPLGGGRGGVDERVAQRIGLQPPVGEPVPAPLRSIARDWVKLIGYVPVEQLEPVRDAVFAAGAGQIGDYDRCSWSVTGTGTFRGNEHSDPTIGEPGSFERVEEARFETILPRHLASRVCRAYAAAHPYEVPAYEVLPLEIPAPVGFGRVGRLGAGGGGAAWTALSEIDPELDAYGSVATVEAGAPCALYGGPVRDVLDTLLAEDGLALLVAGSATELELDLLADRGVAVLLLDRQRAVDAHAMELAGLLTRALTLPVTCAASLHFPEETHLPVDTEAEQLPEAQHRDAAASVFDATPTASPSGGGDFATGTWRLHFDGGSRGNPGPAAYGWVLYGPDGDEYEADGVRIGTATNNVAEWTGLLRGLEHALERGVRTLSVRGDSELVVKQATGVYKVKNAALKPLAEQVAGLLRRFDKVDIKHVYRTDNARADAVANEAMDGLR